MLTSRQKQHLPFQSLLGNGAFRLLPTSFFTSKMDERLEWIRQLETSVNFRALDKFVLEKDNMSILITTVAIIDRMPREGAEYEDMIRTIHSAVYLMNYKYNRIMFDLLPSPYRRMDPLPRNEMEEAIYENLAFGCVWFKRTRNLLLNRCRNDMAITEVEGIREIMVEYREMGQDLIRRIMEYVHRLNTMIASLMDEYQAIMDTFDENEN
uniref:PH domain-containing protein n=2 Tax=Caenorhabditis tropicalis TaxID=1561998 RepID=A0A1I7TBL6_9PELO